MSGIFITGTDTGVGKTYITLLLATAFRGQGLKVGVMKPISCGPQSKNDAVCLKRQLELDDSLDLINPIRLRKPLSPYAAAEMESRKSKVGNRKLKIGKIFSAYKKLSKKYDLVLVEGVGGALVPITDKYYVRDLIKDFGIPALIVARSGLGTINHTLLTIESLKNRNIDILGIILNGFAGKDLSEKSNAKITSKLSGIPVLAEIKWQK